MDPRTHFNLCYQGTCLSQWKKINMTMILTRRREDVRECLGYHNVRTQHIPLCWNAQSPNKGEGDWTLWLHEKYIKAPQLWDHHGYMQWQCDSPKFYFILYFSLFLISNFDWSVLKKKKKKKGIHMLCTSIIKYLYYFLLAYPCWVHLASTFIYSMYVFLTMSGIIFGLGWWQRHKLW